MAPRQPTGFMRRWERLPCKGDRAAKETDRAAEETDRAAKVRESRAAPRGRRQWWKQAARAHQWKGYPCLRCKAGKYPSE